MRRSGDGTAAIWLSGILIALVAALPPPAAQAEEDDDEAAYRALTEYMSWIEVGVRYNEEDDYAFGNYTGLDDEGVTFLGNGDLRWRSEWDSDSAHYIRLRGLNLGLESRYLGFEYKNQGLVGVFLEYDELPRLVTDSASTFFRGVGSERLDLPPGWVPGDTPADMTELESSLSPLKIRTKRKRLSTGVDVELPANFDFDVRYQRETKKGKKLVGAVIGSNGGNPRSVVIPERVDYVTQQVDAALRYTTEDLQVEFAYYASFFDNDEERLVWQNPYTAPPGGNTWNPAAAYPSGRGRLHQAPDNWAQQFSLSGGYNLPFHSRITVNTAFGRMKQDDDEFLRYTVNGALDVTTGLPRDDADAKIDTTLVDVRLVSRPVERVRFKAGYRYDDRDNDTPRETYIYVPGDSQDQGGIAGSTARVNRPYSLERHEVGVETDVRVWERTHLAAGYEFEQTERNLQEVSKLKEHTLSTTLRSHLNAKVSGRVVYEHSWRDPSTYKGAKPLIEGFSPEHIEAEIEDLIDDGFTEEDLWENHPLLRKYYMADRQRDRVRSQINLAPIDTVGVGLHSQFIRDDYNDTVIGLTSSKHLSTGVDISFAPNERFNAHTFYTFERIKSEQQGWSTGGNAIPDSMDPDLRWSARDREKVHTLGAGFDVQVVPDLLSVGCEYLFARSRGQFNISLAPGLADPDAIPYPKNKTTTHALSVQSELELLENLTFRMGYLFERFRSKDWSIDGVTPTTLSRVAAAGNNSPDYTAHVGTWSVIFRFQ